MRNLTKTFGDKTAIAGLSFDVRAGEVLCVLGPNGAGKTTTFLCLAGLLRPDAGSFAWNGAPLPARRGNTIALIPETPDVYAALTVWEHLVFVAKSADRSDWERRAEELLARLGLGDRRHDLGNTLSKGMKQKLLIAATLLLESPVVLFDEPMIGLDPAGQRELREIIADLRDRGTAVLVSTHLLQSASELASRALILKSGRCLYDGSIEELAADGESDLESVFLQITA